MCSAFKKEYYKLAYVNLRGFMPSVRNQYQAYIPFHFVWRCLKDKAMAEDKPLASWSHRGHDVSGPSQESIFDGRALHPDCRGGHTGRAVSPNSYSVLSN